MFPKSELGQPMHDGSVARLAESDRKTYQFVSISIRPLRRAVRSAQVNTR